MWLCSYLSCCRFPETIKKEVTLEEWRNDTARCSYETAAPEATEESEELGESSDSTIIVTTRWLVDEAAKYEKKNLEGGLKLGDKLNTHFLEYRGTQNQRSLPIIPVDDLRIKTPRDYTDQSPWISPFPNSLSARIKRNRRSLIVKRGHSSNSISHSQALTVISDWADAYEGFETPRHSRSSSLLTKTDAFSCIDYVSGRESPLSTSTLNLPQNIMLPPGTVMSVFLSNKGYLFKVLNLNLSVDDVINIFLCADGGPRLPMSFSKTEQNPPRIMSKRMMAANLAENLGPQFDTKTQGLTFATGSLNSRLCYKMSVCELGKIEKMFSTHCRSQNTSLRVPV